MAASRISAGILLYRYKAGGPEFFLVHPGGPFWAKKDAGAWSIPKGEMEPGEEPLQTALREFKEETGFGVKGSFIPLASVRQKNGKLVMAWMLEGDVNAAEISSSLFELEWPPRSGKRVQFPEVDKAGWFTKEQALEKIIPAQAVLIIECLTILNT